MAEIRYPEVGASNYGTSKVAARLLLNHQKIGSSATKDHRKVLAGSTKSRAFARSSLIFHKLIMDLRQDAQRRANECDGARDFAFVATKSCSRFPPALRDIGNWPSFCKYLCETYGVEKCIIRDAIISAIRHTSHRMRRNSKGLANYLQRNIEHG